MHTLTPVSHVTGAEGNDPQTRRIVHTARQFEAVLLNSLFGSLEKTFSSLPGKTQEVGSDDYHHLGMQALASTLSANGGVGIADMIVRHLQNSATPEPPASHENSPAKGDSFEGLS